MNVEQSFEQIRTSMEEFERDLPKRSWMLRLRLRRCRDERERFALFAAHALPNEGPARFLREEAVRFLSDYRKERRAAIRAHPVLWAFGGLREDFQQQIVFEAPEPEIEPTTTTTTTDGLENIREGYL